MKDSKRPVKLSINCTVDQYRQMLDRQDRDAIADFVERRFAERYLDPIEGDKERKNGFTIMAVSCLMIEALESFALGLADSKRKSGKVFSSFFSRWPDFSTFQPVSREFYEHVRCGILHQAETTGGWRIHRRGSLHDKNTINATAFARALRKSLHAYTGQLRVLPWDAPEWIAFRKKMDAICENTETA